MIIPIYQQLGCSTHQLAKSVGEFCGEKSCHTGTLDPMAEGVVIVLTGADRFKKQEYTSCEKEYVFDFVLGLETDSLDLLGLQRNSSWSFYSPTPPILPTKEKLEKVVEEFGGDYTQAAPIFSARKVGGKSLFWYGRENKTPKIIPEIKGKIHQIKLESVYSIALEQLCEEAIEKVNKVKGDFRQEEIIEQWGDLKTVSLLGATPLPHQFPVLQVRAIVSRGIYIRQLAKEIAQQVGTVSTVIKLVRVRNGEFRNSK